VQTLGSPRTKPEAKRFSVLRAGSSLLRGWHLLSLDAPTVAATWCAAFSSAAGVPLTSAAAHAAIAFLSLATWLCYVGDRTQDARASLHASELRPRHRFYGAWWRMHRSSLVALVSVGVIATSALALFGLSRALFVDYVGLTLASLLYFSWVHSGRERAGRAFAKEAAVAVIFALGCILPAWSTASLERATQLLPAGALFALLCWLNCVAIERWEGLGRVHAHAHGSTQWAARHLTALSLGCAAAAVALAICRHTLHRPAVIASLLAPCLACAFVSLAALERWRARISVDSLRVLADVALLTPLGWWLAARFVH